MYIFLIFLYVFSKPKSQPIKTWPHLPDILLDKPKPSSCTSDKECPLDYKCLDNECIPKFLRGTQCLLGEWKKDFYLGAVFAICTCKEPTIYNQKFYGGECNVLVACGEHGDFDPITKKCNCHLGYKEGPNYTCIISSVLEQIAARPCNSDELEVSQISMNDGFHPDYIQKLKSQNLKCVRKPCTFDPNTGSKLTQGTYKSNWGCLCNPRYGLYGIHLNNDKYLQGDGYDACASIYDTEALMPVSVKLFTYYYLGKRPPMAFIQFPLRGKTVYVGQKWPHNYMQYVLDNEDISARIRYCPPGFQGTFYCVEKKYVHSYSKSNCHYLLLNRTDTFILDEYYRNEKYYMFVRYGNYSSLPEHVQAYLDMYAYPACRITENDIYKYNFDKMFSNRVILNPHLLTYPHKRNLFRTNGLLLKYDDDRWHLDTEDGFDLGVYKNIETNAPDL